MTLKDWKKVTMNGSRYRKGSDILNIDHNIKTKRWMVTIRYCNSSTYKYIRFFNTRVQAVKHAKIYMKNN